MPKHPGNTFLFPWQLWDDIWQLTLKEVTDGQVVGASVSLTWSGGHKFQTYVGSNLGCIILDQKITYLKMPSRYIQGEWTGIFFTVECYTLMSTIIRHFTSIGSFSGYIRKCIRFTNFNANSYWLMLKEYKLIIHHKVYLLTDAQGMQTYTSQGLFNWLMLKECKLIHHMIYYAHSCNNTLSDKRPQN